MSPLAKEILDIDAQLAVDPESHETMLASEDWNRLVAMAKLEPGPRLADVMAELTGRRREVLDLALGGLTSKEIAVHLGISHRTVEVHRRSVLAHVGHRSFESLKKAIGSAKVPA